ncbi:hypothetical protein Lal_00021710 [Lupinus albus]|nr:hypothetical protein Lal_00021710 [Lupinus albus]
MVPTMAIEKVYIAKNTSHVKVLSQNQLTIREIVQQVFKPFPKQRGRRCGTYFLTSHTEDRILVHELEHVLIIADPRLFEYSENGDEKNEKNILVFKLHVKCPSKIGQTGINVKPSDLKWLPNGSENGGSQTSFSCSQDSLSQFSNNPPRPEDLNMIFAVFGPGQVVLVGPECDRGVPLLPGYEKSVEPQVMHHVLNQNLKHYAMLKTIASLLLNQPELYHLKHYLLKL